MPKRTAIARRPWTAADQKKLKFLRARGLPGRAIAAALKRTPGAIYQRMASSGLAIPRTKTKKRAGQKTQTRLRRRLGR